MIRTARTTAAESFGKQHLWMGFEPSQRFWGFGLIGLVLLGLVFAGTAPAQADEPIEFITIRVAPWAEIDQTTQSFVGVFPEILAEMERRTELDMDISLEPFARVNRELDSGDKDCTILVWEDARAETVKKGALVSTHIMGVIGRKGIVLNDYEDLIGRTVSVLRGLSVSERFDADSSLKKDFDTDYVMGLRKLTHGRVEAIAGAIATIRHLAREEGLDKMLGDDLLLHVIPLILQCSLKSPNLKYLDTMNEAVNAMIDDGTMQLILDRHNFM